MLARPVYDRNFPALRGQNRVEVQMPNGAIVYSGTGRAAHLAISRMMKRTGQNYVRITVASSTYTRIQLAAVACPLPSGHDGPCIRKPRGK